MTRDDIMFITTQLTISFVQIFLSTLYRAGLVYCTYNTGVSLCALPALTFAQVFFIVLSIRLIYMDLLSPIAVMLAEEVEDPEEEE